MTARRRFIAVANERYVTERRLTRAVSDSTVVADLLRNRHEYESLVLADLPRGELLDRIDQELGEDTQADGVLVLMWTGHGRPGPGELHLLGPTANGDRKVATPAEIAEWAVRTGARQVLVLLDVCYAAGGLPDAIGRAHEIFNMRGDTSRDWFGIFAACRPDEPALSGALATEVARLLRDGPRTERLRREWLLSGVDIAADALFAALTQEWDQPRQTPQPAQLGTAGPMLRNPLLPAPAVEGVVEHLLFAARGTSTDANFFVGREAELGTIVHWLRSAQTGLMLITGPPGCGKSALLGRIVSLSDPAERALITSSGSLPADLDPGQGSIDVNLHARRLRVEQGVEQLCLQLGLPADGSIYDLLGLAKRRRETGQPLVLAVDGLDEAGPLDAPKLGTELLVPLAREAVVLVASRPNLGGEETESVLGPPGQSVNLLDLGAQPATTARDVARYVERRLAGVSARMNPAEVAEEIVDIVRGPEVRRDGMFLLARILTSQLRAEPVDTSEADWPARLARSVGQAVEHDLDRTVLEVDGRARPTAARELLTALAYACGEGFPADDVWLMIATALSPTGSEFERADLEALLEGFGRHIVVGRERDQVVFRLAHQRLVEYLMNDVEPDRRGSDAVALAVHRAYRKRLDAGTAATSHVYLWRYAWRHFADAGSSGLDLLRELVARDRAAFLRDLALALDRAADLAMQEGRVADALVHQQEAVKTERELAPGGSLALSLALFDLATTLSVIGHVEEASEIAEEGASMAWRFASEPDGALVVAGALSARALARRSLGDNQAAVRFAAEAAALLSGDGGELEPVLRGQRAMAQNLVADALIAQGRLEEAAVAAAEAVRDATIAANGQPDMGLLIALATAALVDVNESSSARPTASADVTPATVASQLIGVLEQIEPRGSLQELAVADALRVVAACWATLGDRSGVRDELQALQYLDRALALATPHADSSLMGALAYVYAALLKSGMVPGSVDIAEAEARLQPFVEQDSRAAVLLAGMVGQRAADANRPIAERMENAIRAAELLAAGNFQPLQRQRVHMLCVAASLAIRSGNRGLALVALEDACVVLESKSVAIPERDRLLGLLLSERCGLLAGSRRAEAVELGQQAIRQLRGRTDDPAGDVALAQAELNLGTIELAYGRLEAAADAFRDALEVVSKYPDLADAQMLRGMVLANVVSGRVAAGTVDQSVVADAREALSLLAEAPGELVGGGRAIAQLALAQGMHRIGAPAADIEAACRLAAADLVDLIDGPEEFGALNNLVNVPAEHPIWAALYDRKDAAERWRIPLRLWPARGLDQLAETVADLSTAISDVGDDHQLRNELRGLARIRREINPLRFTAAWSSFSGEPAPSWLEFDVAHGDVVVAWLNTSTWLDSREFLAAHPELLEPRTELHLVEVGDNAPELLAVHLELIRAAREGTAEGVFDRLHAAELAEAWLSEEDLIGFLDDHLAEVPREVLAGVLRERGALVEDAVLTLFSTGERSLAERICNGRAPWEELLRGAWRSGDAPRLHALSVLCRWSERSDDHDRALGEIAELISLALLGDVDESVSLLQERRPEAPELLTRWRDAVVDSIAYDQTGNSAALSRLLAALREI